MARPQTNKIGYFPHSVTHGKKMSYIEKKYGNNGYATWFKILEELGNTEFHYLNLSDEIQIMFLSDRCLVDEIVLVSIIEDLVKLKEFDKTLWDENKILWSDKFISSIGDAYKKRINDCIDENSLLTLLDSLGVRKLSKIAPKHSKDSSQAPINPQSKEEKRREKKSKENTDIDFLYSLYPTRCENRKASTSKTSSNKTKIKTLLKTHSKEELETIITRTVEEKKKEKGFLKNFDTFLNNLPDYNEEIKKDKDEKENYVYFKWHNDGSDIKPRKIEKDKADAYFANQLLGGYKAIIRKS